MTITYSRFFLIIQRNLNTLIIQNIMSVTDKEKHMLVFDIIYCCTTYHLFDGITFKRLSTKEKPESKNNRQGKECSKESISTGIWKERNGISEKSEEVYEEFYLP